MTPERHNELVPMGTQVSSKGRFRFCEGYGPEWIEAAEGAWLADNEEREYVDTTGGLGALVLGHGAGMDWATRVYPLPHPDEGRLAEYINARIPWAEQMRFLKTGTDATSAAVRLARVKTGRDIIVDFGDYHGWADAFITPDHEGVPKAVRDLTRRHLATPENLEHVDETTAAVILEPHPLGGIDHDFLRALRKRCDQVGAVLIFDEVISGFRLAFGGAAEVTGVVPDLTCAGKAMANVAPISVVYGKRSVMECWSRTHISGTHFADPTCMEAALWVLEQTNGSVLFPVDPPVLPSPFQVRGTRMWWTIRADAAPLTLLQKRLMDLGYLTNFSHFWYRDLAPVYDDYLRHLKGHAEDIAGMTEEQILAELGDIPLNRAVFRRSS